MIVANLVSPSNSRKAHIFDSSFTVGGLAFLCSRLLSSTKRARAAIVLQSAWRRVLAHREAHRRDVARNLALQCAAVVQTRDRLLRAKTIILRWWRRLKNLLRCCLCFFREASPGSNTGASMWLWKDACLADSREADASKPFSAIGSFPLRVTISFSCICFGRLSIWHWQMSYCTASIIMGSL